MSAKKIYAFNPDYAIHPGEILDEIINARGIPKGELAERCGLSPKTVSLIINGKAPVTPETSLQLEKVLGVSADIWNNLDSNYRLHTARAEKLSELGKMAEWLKKFPLTILKRQKVITNSKNISQSVNELLTFFGVATIEAWNELYGNIAVAYRKSPAYESDPWSIAAWLRMAEIMSEDIETEPYDKGQFKKALGDIRKLTNMKPEIFEDVIRELCKNTGVSFVVLKEFPKTRLHGATRWINNSKAMIALTLRYKYEGQFWFSFFHEAAHIILHEKSRVFIDHAKPRTGVLEDEANRFAEDFLIPPREYSSFVSGGDFSRSKIIAFAENIGISPGIVAGRLHHDEHIHYSVHSDLKRRFDLIE